MWQLLYPRARRGRGFLLLACVLPIPTLSAQSVRLVRDINTKTVVANPDSQPRSFVALGASTYFVADLEGLGRRLFRTQGTTATTEAVPWVLQRCPTDALAAFGSAVFFTRGSTSPMQLWKTDGTAAGTVLVRDGLAVDEFALHGGSLFFSASGALWKTDGTTMGTVKLKDLGSDSLTSFTSVGSMLFFLSKRGSYFALWRTDGSAAGTIPLASSSGADFGVLGSEVLFAGYDSLTGHELWKSDGTAAGTVLLKDICPGTSLTGTDSDPASFATIGGAVYFAALDKTAGRELWKSDGSASGTVLVKDVRPGSSSSGMGGPRERWCAAVLPCQRRRIR